MSNFFKKKTCDTNKFYVFSVGQLVVINLHIIVTYDK